jgi:hypothetical protein
MKHQISRLSPHQNAKVFAVLMTVASLVFLVPIMLLSSAFSPGRGVPIMMVVVLPLFYLVIGYVMTVVGCWFYNVMFQFVGGIEFESKNEGA